MDKGTLQSGRHGWSLLAGKSQTSHTGERQPSDTGGRRARQGVTRLVNGPYLKSLDPRLFEIDITFLLLGPVQKDHYGLRLEISRIKVDARSTSKTERKEGRRSLGDLKDLKDTVGYSLSLNG
ncbi:hypothetical protein H106_08182 [Trichophyton rubrum CBS 735.88]|nr:hypothetical protein H106_08182 [Trichophyton rubrum CBS 735.88]